MLLLPDEVLFWKILGVGNFMRSLKIIEDWGSLKTEIIEDWGTNPKSGISAFRSICHPDGVLPGCPLLSHGEARRVT